MKFVKSLVFGAALALTGVIAGNLGHGSTTAYAAGCDAHGIGGRTMTNNTNNTAYKINGNVATVTFDVVGNDCDLPVTMIAWKAPNGTDGKPYSQQTIFATNEGKRFKAGRHSMSVQLPDCYFQVDTVTGTKLTGSTDGAHNYDGRQVAFMHGGTQTCTPPVTPPVNNIQVCDLKTFQIVTIAENQYNEALYSKDLSKCSPITVCDLTTKTIVTIPQGQYNETRYSKDLTKCAPTPPTPGKIVVCDITTKTVVTILEKDFDAAKYTKDLSVCNKTPETPTTITKTGPEAGILSLFGAGTISGSAYYWFQSRRDLINKFLKR